MIQIEFLPASNRNSVFLSIKNENFILIDSVFAQTYSKHIKKINFIKSSEKVLRFNCYNSHW